MRVVKLFNKLTHGREAGMAAIRLFLLIHARPVLVLHEGGVMRGYIA